MILSTHTGEATPGVLDLDLGSPVQETCGLTGMSTVKDHEGDE